MVHMVHTAQTRMIAHFFAFQSWYTCWYTVGTHGHLAGTHVPQSMFHSLLCPLTVNRGPYFTISFLNRESKSLNSA